jgi:hypothetical protein
MYTDFKKKYYQSPKLIDAITEVRCLVRYLHLRNHVLASDVDADKIYRVGQMRKSVSESIHKTCHIIGSGESVLSSIATIDNNNDFIIGFNYAGFLPLKFDVYFVEVATHIGNQSISSSLHEELFSGVCSSKRPKVYVKCLWQEQNWSSDFIRSSYGGDLGVLLDIFPDFPLLARSQVINVARQRLMSRRRNTYFLNGASSAIFSVLFAYQMGFRNIVVHGVDFVGAHYFHSKDLVETALVNKVRGLCPYVPASASHGAGRFMSLEWPHVVTALAKHGVTVYAGSNTSLFSTYAPVYIA